jgi:hypothetical protein
MIPIFRATAEILSEIKEGIIDALFDLFQDLKKNPFFGPIISFIEKTINTSVLFLKQNRVTGPIIEVLSELNQGMKEGASEISKDIKSSPVVLMCAEMSKCIKLNGKELMIDDPKKVLNSLDNKMIGSYKDWEEVKK